MQYIGILKGEVDSHCICYLTAAVALALIKMSNHLVEKNKHNKNKET